MSTSLAPPPARPPIAQRRSRSGGAPARRAIRRWAWRLLRREWRQQLLVLSLLAVAVAATTVGLGLVTNFGNGNVAVLGSATGLIDITGVGPAGLDADVTAAQRSLGSVEAIARTSVPVPGSVTPVELRAQDPHGIFGAPMLALVSGRYPVGPGEAAVTNGVAATFGLTLGSTWAADSRTLRVVGIVENPHNLQDAFGLVAAGQIPVPRTVTLLTDAATAAMIAFRPPVGTAVGVKGSRQDAAARQRTQALAVLLLATIGMLFIGLLAVAGFTVMAHRRLRSLGMIGAIGATDRQVRAVMVANGTAVGTLGATAGVGFGVALWLALTPAFEKLVGHRYNPFQLPWWAVIAGAGLAVLTAVAAAWWPARAAARLPIVAALSGRPAPPQPAHRFALLGTVLAAAGFVCLVLAGAQHSVLIVFGILAFTAAMLLLAPLGIRVLASVATHAPVAVRLALRDLARYQSRSGAALAAASLAVGIAATIAVTAAAQQAHDLSFKFGNLPNNQLIVWLVNPASQNGPGISVAPAGGGQVSPTAPSQAVVSVAQAKADRIAGSLGTSIVVELDAAVDLATPLPANAPPDAGQATLVRPINVPQGQGWNQVATPYIATPGIVALYRLSGNNAANSSDILSSRTDLTGVQLGTGFRGNFRPVVVQTVTQLPSYTSAPNTLITPKAVASGGYTPEPVAWLIQTPHQLTAAQIIAADQQAATAGLTVEVRNGPNNSLRNLRDYATLAGLLVTLGVLAMTIGLIRSETAGDLRTLAASGASGRTRRTVNAASAASLALLGGILGTATAYLALIAWHWHNVSYLNQPPYPDLAVLIIGLPVIAATGAWLFGRPPTDLGRALGN